MKNNSETRTKTGFTLIELLIVVAIIAILAAIAVPNFLEAQVRSKVSRARADMRTIATALESYAVDNNKYPRAPEGITCPTTEPLVHDCNGYGSFRDSELLTVPDTVTTPISYISSQIPDVFKLGKKVTSGNAIGEPYSQGNERDRTFMYLNIAQATEPAFGFYTTPAQIQNAKDNLGGWQLRSLGPSSEYSNPAGGTTVISIKSVYDSSNGTISFGHIIRNQKDTEGSQSDVTD